jgi:hypothetical protein
MLGAIDLDESVESGGRRPYNGPTTTSSLRWSHRLRAPAAVWNYLPQINGDGGMNATGSSIRAPELFEAGQAAFDAPPACALGIRRALCIRFWRAHAHCR